MFEAGGPFAVDGPQRVVGEEVLEDRVGVDGVDPLDESRGEDALLDDSGLLRIGGSGYYRSLCKIVGGRLPLGVRDVHEEVGEGCVARTARGRRERSDVRRRWSCKWWARCRHCRLRSW